MSNPNANLYAEYLKNPELIWPAIPVSIFNVLTTLIGAVGNFSVAYLTFKCPRLHTPCNFYLAFMCIADTVNMAGCFTYFYVMVSGEHFIRLESCFWLQIGPIIGLASGVILPMLIGVDRFVSVLYHSKYSMIQTSWLVAGSLLISLFYSTLVVLNAYKNVIANPEIRVNCKTPDPILVGNSEFFLLSCITMTLTAVVVYSLIWLRVLISELSTSRSVFNRSTQRTYFAFTVIVIELLFGWISSSATKLILKFLQVGTVSTFQITLLNGIFLYVIWASNALVLFTFSSDYRHALKRELGIEWRFGRVTDGTKIVTTVSSRTNR